MVHIVESTVKSISKNQTLFRHLMWNHLHNGSDISELIELGQDPRADGNLSHIQCQCRIHVRPGDRWPCQQSH